MAPAELWEGWDDGTRDDAVVADGVDGDCVAGISISQQLATDQGKFHVMSSHTVREMGYS